MPIKAPVRQTKVYARVTGGSRQLWCPMCGAFNYHKAPLWEVLVKVRCSSCLQIYYWGSVLYMPANSACMDTPPDVIAPQFADVQLRRRRKGQPVNKLRRLSDDGLSWTEIDLD